MKKLIIAIIVIVFTSPTFSQVYKSKKGGVKVSFFSETPMENISAENTGATSLIMNDSVIFRIPNKSFNFPKPLMQEHFNENYMESEKYPTSSFRGKINEKTDLSKDGTYKVTCTGRMNIHGVDKIETFPGTITVKGEEIQLLCNFNIKEADYKIQVPKLVIEKIAESIAVKVDAAYNPYKKP